jgi:hypothetical protein
MKPLPVQRGIDSIAPIAAPAALPGMLASPSASYSTANRRSSSNPAQRAYPWLLSISTLVAAVFCLLYITKPVIMVPTGGLEARPEKPAIAMAGKTAATTPVDLVPNRDLLPGEKKSILADPAVKSSNPRKALPPPPFSANFEETNLRIQHVLTAEAPGGHLDRIDINVPVLYQSRNMRWTAAETAEARQLLGRLMNYQEKSLQLRAEGVELLELWNRLISNSIPASELRADSPTLPANQQDAADAARPAGLITTESIQIKPPVK